jgi:hypothetical protein
LPMPALWRAHDRYRGVRARLPAELPADTKQDRHLMSQTSCERCSLPVPMRWLHAGSHLSRPNSIHQCVGPRVNTLRTPPPEMPTALCRPLSRHPSPILSASRRPSRSAATLNPLSARRSAGAQLPATSCLGAFWTPVTAPAEAPCCRRPKTSTITIDFPFVIRIEFLHRQEEGAMSCGSSRRCEIPALVPRAPTL